MMNGVNVRMRHKTGSISIIRYLYRFLAAMAVLLCICTPASDPGSNFRISDAESSGWNPMLRVAAYGMENDSAKDSQSASVTGLPRLTVSASRLWLNGKGELKVTFKNRTEADSVEVSAKAPKAVSIRVGAWEGDTCSIALTPLKNKNTYLYISSGSETVKVKLLMTKETEMSGEDIYAKAFDAMVEIRTVDTVGEEYVGSGFFIGDRLILSNYHVVSSASYFEIYDYYNNPYTVRYVRDFDEEKDLVLFEVKESNKAAFTFSDTVKGGETVYSIGSPVGLTGTFVHGIVANPNQAMYDVDEESGEKTLNHYVQVSIPNGTGCGGGPVINSKGQVIGVSTMTITSTQNISLAIGYEKIMDFLSNPDGSSAMTFKKFCSLHAGRYKESNLYEFSVQENIRDRADMAGDTTASGNNGDNAGDVLSAEDIYAEAYNAMVEVWIRKNGAVVVNGSGFFISDDVVVTCNHVVNEYPIDHVVDYNGNIYNVSDKKSISEDYDIALLSVTSKETGVEHDVVRLNARYIPVVGEKVYAFGSPAGKTASLSEGVISMSRRTMMNIEGIQFDAAIAPGSSGGALFNKYGEVIGVTFATVLISEHNNFALPVKYIGRAQ